MYIDTKNDGCLYQCLLCDSLRDVMSSSSHPLLTLKPIFLLADGGSRYRYFPPFRPPSNASAMSVSTTPPPSAISATYPTISFKTTEGGFKDEQSYLSIYQGICLAIISTYLPLTFRISDSPSCSLLLPILLSYACLNDKAIEEEEAPPPLSNNEGNAYSL